MCVNKNNPTASYVSESLPMIVIEGITNLWCYRNTNASYVTTQRPILHSRSSKQQCTIGCMYYVRYSFLRPSLFISIRCSLWNTWVLLSHLVGNRYALCCCDDLLRPSCSYVYYRPVIYVGSEVVYVLAATHARSRCILNVP